MTGNKRNNINKELGGSLPDINSMGLMHFDPIWAIEEHATACCELLHIVNGNMELTTHDFQIQAKAGDTLIVPSHLLHKDEFDFEQDLEIFYVSFSWEQEDAYFKYVKPTDVLSLSSENKNEISLLFDSLRGDIAGSTAEDRLMARVRVLTIMLLIMKETGKAVNEFDNDKDSTDTIAIRHEKIVKMAKQYMQKNFSKMISLDDIAEHVGISTYHLSHIFGDQSDFTVYNYLMTLRMKKAKSLLKESNLNVSDVAYAVGYNDPQYFSKVFRKYHGVSPSQFAKDLGGVGV